MKYFRSRISTIIATVLIAATPRASADITVSSDPVGYYRIPLVVGYQTIGVSLVHSPVFVTALASSDADTVTATEATVDVGALLDASKQYYIEVVAGPTGINDTLVGHRFEVNETVTINAGTPNGAIELDPTAEINTAFPVPNLAGYRIELRPHVTFAEAFSKDPLYASFDLGLADQVQIYNGSSFKAYYLLGWTNLNDGPRYWMTFNFQIVDNQIIPPGTGVLYKRSGQAPGPVDLVISGKVRANPFYQTLDPGFSFISEPYPVSSSFTTRNAFPSAFNYSFDIGLADQVQVYDGTSFTTYFLAGGASTAKIWLLTNNFLINQNDNTIFDFRRSVFVKKSNPALGYRIPLGWTP